MDIRAAFNLDPQAELTPELEEMHVSWLVQQADRRSKHIGTEKLLRFPSPESSDKWAAARRAQLQATLTALQQTLVYNSPQAKGAAIAAIAQYSALLTPLAEVQDAVTPEEKIATVSQEARWNASRLLKGFLHILGQGLLRRAGQ